MCIGFDVSARNGNIWTRQKSDQIELTTPFYCFQNYFKPPENIYSKYEELFGRKNKTTKYPNNIGLIFANCEKFSNLTEQRVLLVVSKFISTHYQQIFRNKTPRRKRING